MAAETSWHRYGTKLRHCHSMHRPNCCDGRLKTAVTPDNMITAVHLIMCRIQFAMRRCVLSATTPVCWHCIRQQWSSGRLSVSRMDRTNSIGHRGSRAKPLFKFPLRPANVPLIDPIPNRPFLSNYACKWGNRAGFVGHLSWWMFLCGVGYSLRDTETVLHGHYGGS